MVELKEVHRQRLRGAVEASRKGSNVRFIICGDKVMYHIGTGKNRILCNGYGNMEAWRKALVEEFNSMLSKRSLM